MNKTSFIERQIAQVRQGGRAVLFRKIKLVFHQLPLVLLAIPVVMMIRLIKPWVLVRWYYFTSWRIGPFAANIELYLCERDAGINTPRRRHVDVFLMGRPICNQQLAKMWKRVLHVWPAWIPANTLRFVNRLIPGGAAHEICNNTQGDRDVLNLLDRSSPHLQFTTEEKIRGEAGLRKMGIPTGTPFVCLIVRDSAYLHTFKPQHDWSYFNFRDSDVQNYVLTAEELAGRGYFVIRMGAKVREPIKSGHPRVIDYATNGMRSDFMDIYLGAKCEFCISTGTGWDAVPGWLFRKPVVFTNQSPVGHLSHSDKFLFITKRHFDSKRNRELTLVEIFTRGVGLCFETSCYESKGVQLIENTPEEIRDVVVEMAERLSGTWHAHEDDEALQRKFWEIFPIDAKDPDGKPLHGEIRARFGAHFLRNNRAWLQ